MSTLSACVVTYNSETDIEPCLRALLGESVDATPIDIVVVDNASTDRTPEMVARLAARSPQLRLIAEPENHGFAQGCNIGLDACSGNYIAFINPDCIVDAGALQRLVTYLRETQSCGVAAALLRYPDGRPQLFARREFTVAGLWATQTLLGRRRDNQRNGIAWAHRCYADDFTAVTPSSAPIPVDCPAAACVVLARSDEARMSPQLPLLFNDAELYWRIRRAGLQCTVVPAAGARHGYGTSLNRTPDRRIRAEFVASCVRYHVLTGRPGMAAVAWLIFALDVLLSAACGLLGPGGAEGRYLARSHARGTAGGLGWPGGDAPWLCRPARLPFRPSLRAHR